MRKLTIVFWLLAILGCRPSFQEKVNHETVSCQDATGERYTADLYVLKNKKPGAAVVILSQSLLEQKRWSEMAARIAVQNYLVLLVSTGNEPGKPWSLPQGTHATQAWRSFLAGNFPQLKVGLMGSEQTCSLCMVAGGADSTIAAAVLLTPAEEISQLDSATVQSWKGRPLLLIAAEKDPRWDADQAQQFYDRIADPKKLVWLAGAKKGVDLLSSDQEPIIRRTTVLLFDRHLLGKK